MDWLQQNPTPLVPGSVSGRAALEKRAVHVHDVLAESGYQALGLQRLQDYRTVLAVPMLREDDLVGVITILKTEVAPFSQRSSRAGEDLRRPGGHRDRERPPVHRNCETRNRDLTETLEQQTATSEILRVISSSPTDARPVFDTIVGNARRLCGADSAIVSIV